MTQPNTLCFEFPKAANNTSIGGSAHNAIVKHLMPETDVLILSDTQHSKNTDMYENTLSADQVVDFAKSGVTEIFIELSPFAQTLIDQLAGDAIDRETFIAEMFNNGHVNMWLPPEEQLKQLGDVATMISAASEQGIIVYGSQLPNTDEQNAQIDAMMMEVGGKYQNANDLIDAFFDKAQEQGIIMSEADVNAIHGLSDPFLIFSDDYNGNYVGKAYDLLEPMSARYPELDFLKFSREIVGLKSEQWSLENSVNDLNYQFRIDNDPLLANMVDERTRGKAIVIHGADHGAQTMNDLDENLQALGQSVARVNLMFDEGDIRSVANEADPAEFDYYVDEDRLQLTDHNEDGCIEGAPAPISLDNNNTLIVGMTANS